MLEQEQVAEENRLRKINAAENEEDKERLTRENEQAKALASDKIARLQQSHQQEIKVLLSE